jgi:hypothetical protein
MLENEERLFLKVYVKHHTITSHHIETASMHQKDDGMKRSRLLSLRYIIDQSTSIRNEITAAYQGRSSKVKSLFDTFAAFLCAFIRFSNPDPEIEIEYQSVYARADWVEAFVSNNHGLRTAFGFLFRRRIGSRFTN